MNATKWNCCLILTILLGGGTACLAQPLPTIIDQPQSQSVPQGSNVTFTVTVSSVTYPTYQWRFNGNNLADATNSSLTLLDVQPWQGGYYSVVVSNSVGYTISSNALLTVLTPGTVQFDTLAYTVPENAGQAVITITRSGGAFGPANVSYSTADASAVASVDYSATTGMVAWADGDMAPKSFTVPIIDDMIHQGDRYFLVNLGSPTGVSLGNPSTATVTIMDNELPARI